MIYKHFLLFFIFFITGNAYSQADFTIQGNLCQFNELTFIDASVAASSYAWEFGDGNTSSEQNPFHAYMDSGSYTVKLTITVGLNTFNRSRIIFISKNPTADFTIDSTSYSSYSRVFKDSSLLFNNFSKNLWRFGDGTDLIEANTATALYKFPDKGSYTVWMTVYDQKGCVDSVSKTVQINDFFRVPNVFTPNADQVNDQFIVTSNGVTLFSIEIYSRWGNLVFKRKGQEQVIWDGRLPDGNLVKPGTYFYVITAESGTTNYDLLQGFVTVFY